MHKINISDEIIERIKKRRGRVHLFDKLNPHTSALIVIDMQNAFCKPGAPVEVPLSRDIVPNINQLAAALREAGGEVIWVVTEISSHRGLSDWENFLTYIVASEVREKTMNYMEPGAEGSLLWPPLDKHATDISLVKNRYSCLAPGASPLERVLRSRGIDTLLIAGTKTNICCETTARDAFDMDFKVVLVSDCCAALSDREHQASMESIIQQFGDVLSTDEVIATPAMKTTEDNLRLAIQAAAAAREHGNHPFGAVLIAANGELLLSAENTVLSDRDATAHAELNLLRVATKKYSAEELADCTLYASAEPCPMCAAAMVWSNIRNVSFALGMNTLYELFTQADDVPTLKLASREIFSHAPWSMQICGPLLETEAALVHRDFW